MRAAAAWEWTLGTVRLAEEEGTSEEILYRGSGASSVSMSTGKSFEPNFSCIISYTRVSKLSVIRRHQDRLTSKSVHNWPLNWKLSTQDSRRRRELTRIDKQHIVPSDVSRWMREWQDWEFLQSLKGNGLRSTHSTTFPSSFCITLLDPSPMAAIAINPACLSLQS